MANMQHLLDSPLPSGKWTFYFHSPKEKRWTLDTFKPIATVGTLRETLALFQELGDKLKRGMYFCMKEPIPPLWENYQNIRGGSYSLRGSQEDGAEFFKLYTLASMLQQVVKKESDSIVGMSMSPKIIGNGSQQKVGFYVIKIWNRDSSKFNLREDLELLHPKLKTEDILYTPHVEKKM